MPAIFLFLSFPTYADLPLTVENLLSDKGKARFEFSANYANSERRGVDVSDTIAVQTGTASFVNVPSQIGERLSNTDALVTTAGIRYGLSKNTEIYTSATAFGVDSRSESGEGVVSKRNDSHFSDAWVGVNHRIRDDTDKPAIFGFTELQVAERQTGGNTAYGKSLLVGMTTYQTYDPVVLALTGAVQLNTNRKDGDTDYRPGNSLSISPTVGFAVNDKVTLSSGLNWRMQQADTRDGETQGIRRTSTSLDLGLGYAFSKHDTLDVSVRPQVSGDGDVQVGVAWLHRLEK
ncbi:hypothetical protein HMY34_01395 [Thiothrix subterranea]|uniref:transporter n=1 Tax=Thiothrix subterranea TaxID=2735563 RepID=UPI00192AFF80|nr:transporter [Thiothrix subterranea]QQZ27518.1 hypothetical protein HMY34_01395 [Thiothrix subterranea]